MGPDLDVLLLGDLNVDTMMAIHQYPPPGGDGLSDFVEVEVGGAVANSAVTLARLGLRTGLVGALGRDAWAEQVTRPLEAEGIDLRRVVRVERGTGLSMIVATPDGERTMFSFRGANEELPPAHISAEMLAGAGVLHFSGYAFLKPPQAEAAWKAAALGAQMGVPLSLDSGLEPVLRSPEEMRRLLPQLTLCITGLEEMHALAGSEQPEAALDALMAQGVRLGAVKLGAHGCWLGSHQGEKCFFPIFPIETVDTTGAGDAFSAGLLFALRRGLSLAAAGTLASALGALATTRYGAGMKMPGAAQVCAFLRSRSEARTGGAFCDGAAEVLAALSCAG